jgi:hypothetical protein
MRDCEALALRNLSSLDRHLHEGDPAACFEGGAVIHWTALDLGTHRMRCPACNRSKRDTALAVTIEAPGRGVAYCHRCHYVESWRDDHTAARPGTPKAPPQAAQRFEVLSAYGRELWEACRPVAGRARAYLEARGCLIPPADGDLRWHPALRHRPSGHDGAALVALLTDAVDRTPRTLHRTWVQANGQKAAVEPARMLLGGHRKAGAVCRLWPDEAVTHGLGVAEGIETALSLAHGMTPVWAAIDAGNLAELAVLPGVKVLTVAADHDEAGLKAARACAARWRGAGRRVRLVMPDAFGQDLNDEARAAV